MKPEYIVSAMLTAFQISQHSHCVRRKAGAMVIARDPVENRPVVLGWGTNGMPTGHDTNCCEIPASEDFVPQEGDPYGHLMTNPSVVHAEVRALQQAGERARGAIVVCTDTPCPQCMEALNAAGIAEFYYMFDYRLMDHLAGAEFKISKMDAGEVMMFASDVTRALRVRMIADMREKAGSLGISMLPMPSWFEAAARERPSLLTGRGLRPEMSSTKRMRNYIPAIHELPPTLAGSKLYRPDPAEVMHSLQLSRLEVALTGWAFNMDLAKVREHGDLPFTMKDLRDAQSKLGAHTEQETDVSTQDDDYVGPDEFRRIDKLDMFNVSAVSTGRVGTVLAMDPGNGTAALMQLDDAKQSDSGNEDQRSYTTSTTDTGNQCND